MVLCMCGFCKVWVCVCVDFVKCGCVYVCGFCDVLVCVSVDFVNGGCVFVWNFVKFRCVYVWIL